MNLEYSTALALAYFAALLGWWLAARMFASLWPPLAPPKFAHPWREVGYALLAAIAVIGVGQLYQRGIRLELRGALAPVGESLNQLAIFAPMLVLLAVRRQPLATTWVRTDRLAWRVLVGAVLAVVAVIVFTSLHADADRFWLVLPRVVTWRHVDELVQVFLEDIAIAILAVRLAAATRPWIAVVVVATLFAAGHVPAMLSSGASADELLGLVRDAALGAAVIAVLQRAADITWFAVVHFALDLMQFESGARL